MGAISDLADGLAKVQSLRKEMSDADFQELILDIRGILADVRDENISLRDANRELENEIRDLNSKANFENTLIEIEGFKYDCVDGKPKGYPYCPICDVREGEKYRLSRNFSVDYSDCKNCNTSHNAGKDGWVNRDTPITISGSKTGPTGY